MITRLADLYRGILESSRAPTGPLMREVEIATNYLELERMRFGKRLAFTVSVDDAARAAYLPGLLLQTLAENAVKHGIGPAREGGTVAIDVTRRDDGWFELAVANTGARLGDAGTAARPGTGTGVANTRRRLDLLYGARHGFALTSDAAGRTVARFAFSGEKIDG
jgi:LytS/YehU family sensor histidine kinase